jgi:hypothetical protein
MCVFASWNVDGIMAGFSPSEAYRRTHSKDATQSPLVQKALIHPTPLERGFPANEVLPKTPPNPLFPIPTYNSIIESLRKLADIRGKI